VGARPVTPRVVLDTNVVVSALLFETGQLAWFRQAWREGICSPLVSPATAAELLRVLGYPRFGLAREDIEILLGDFLPFAEVVEPAARDTGWPDLADPDDRIFLEMVVAGRASYLVTGDRALLSLSPPRGCRIITPAEFREILNR
jgi:putative PIN family toxin of toxin-antitoxin system